MNSLHFLKLLVVPALLSLTSCNVFDPVDTPSGDEQILSAARACFDQGDLTCAREWYAKLSIGSGDSRASEEAFATLHEYGASMEDFLSAAGSSGAGASALTALANKMAPGSGITKRLGIFSAYKYVVTIQNAEVRGFVRFITAFFLAAEILGEDSGTDMVLQKTDLVADANSCSCVTCTSATTSILTAAARVDLIVSPLTQTLTGTPTLGMFDGAIAAVSHALTSEIIAGGKFNSGSSGFLNGLTTYSASNNPCYRYALITYGVGL